MELFLQNKDIMDVHTKLKNVPCTLSPIIMKVQNYPKWKETTIGDIPFFTSMILGGRVWLCDIFSMIQFYYKLQHEKSVEVSVAVSVLVIPNLADQSSGQVVLIPGGFLSKMKMKKAIWGVVKIFKTSQNETIHAMVIWNNSQHGSCNLVSFKPFGILYPNKKHCCTAPQKSSYWKSLPISTIVLLSLSSSEQTPWSPTGHSGSPSLALLGVDTFRNSLNQI